MVEWDYVDCLSKINVGLSEMQHLCFEGRISKHNYSPRDDQIDDLKLLERELGLVQKWVLQLIEIES